MHFFVSFQFCQFPHAYVGPTDVRWAGEPSAIVRYVRVVGDVDDTVVVAADGVLLTGSDERRISHSQQIVFTDKQRQHHV